MPDQHYTNFTDLTQEKFWANIEQKDKIVRKRYNIALILLKSYLVLYYNFE